MSVSLVTYFSFLCEKLSPPHTHTLLFVPAAWTLCGPGSSLVQFSCIPSGPRNPVFPCWSGCSFTAWPVLCASCFSLLQPPWNVKPHLWMPLFPSCNANTRQSGFSLCWLLRFLPNPPSHSVFLCLHKETCASTCLTPTCMDLHAWCCLRRKWCHPTTRHTETFVTESDGTFALVLSEAAES